MNDSNRPAPLDEGGPQAAPAAVPPGAEREPLPASTAEEGPARAADTDTISAANAYYRQQLEAARDALEAAGMSGAHGEDWPDILPALDALVADRDRLREQLRSEGEPGEEEVVLSPGLFGHLRNLGRADSPPVAGDHLHAGKGVWGTLMKDAGLATQDEEEYFLTPLGAAVISAVPALFDVAERAFGKLAYLADNARREEKKNGSVPIGMENSYTVAVPDTIAAKSALTFKHPDGAGVVVETSIVHTANRLDSISTTWTPTDFPEVWGPDGAMGQSEKRNPEMRSRRVVADGSVYYHMPETERGPRGYGGREWTIAFFDGPVITTRNLWSAGQVPPAWRDRWPDNAHLTH